MDNSSESSDQFEGAAGKVSPLLSVFLLNIPAATFNTGRTKQLYLHSYQFGYVHYQDIAARLSYFNHTAS